MKTFVVDTNVPIVANGRNTTASLKCQLICTEILEKIVDSDCVAIDDNGFIMDEYHRHLNFHGQPSIGDAFYRHIFLNQGCPDKVKRIKISPTDIFGNFREFPNSDANLNGFDLSDRKFVAVALTSLKKPEILNATDSDWSNYAVPLSRYVKVRELCK